MFALPFVNDATLQKDSYKDFKKKEAMNNRLLTNILNNPGKWAPDPPEVKEAQEAAYREEYGADYIEDRPATPKELNDLKVRAELKSRNTCTYCGKKHLDYPCDEQIDFLDRVNNKANGN